MQFMQFSIIFQLINLVLLAGGIAAFVLFVIVLLKLNKALNIWLKRNESDNKN